VSKLVGEQERERVWSDQNQWKNVIQEKGNESFEFRAKKIFATKGNEKKGQQSRNLLQIQRKFRWYLRTKVDLWVSIMGKKIWYGDLPRRLFAPDAFSMQKTTQSNKNTGSFFGEKVTEMSKLPELATSLIIPGRMQLMIWIASRDHRAIYLFIYGDNYILSISTQINMERKTAT